ncbi:hypothetical protein KC887_00145 [Candidatus Kaiserbacteria bacterium]|nr:hypothetical protein [Candidatus Kaiserbacteria bacterium]
MLVMASTMYHRVLRVAALVCALTLLFESGLLSETTRSLSVHTNQYLANAVGVGASVAPTELNTLTAEITKQKLALAEREAAVQEREIAVNLSEQGGGSNEVVVYIMAAVLFILLVLIVLNYVLDFLHRREVSQPAV